ncbi:Fpg/Nei family DNA glycosylase [Cumulibacter manganitolerans]|uniref:Fpg/Nei family DNA glycosylase n=1 Tax=Cumulibacter manganitolerans TaxID=1884992 RepID=UPI0012980AD5|nr:DNA-formamidopyrimidine glycosylase family protein [Cumulibacter manganitolerans]
MPEGHTLHRIGRELTDAFAGTAPAVTSPQGRFAESAAILDGRPFERAWAHGKLLFVEIGGQTVHIHLGLIGKLAVHATDGAEPAVQGAVRLRLLNERYVADLRGPMVCTLVTPVEVDALVARQGPDPLQPSAEPTRAWERIHRSGKSIAELMMDQSVIAGVGNIYRCEVLWRQRVNPAYAGRRIKRGTVEAMWHDLVRLMHVGVHTGRIITVEEDVADAERDIAQGALKPAYDRPNYVYQRDGQPCPRCGARIRTRVVAGRNLFWCGGCQRRT